MELLLLHMAEIETQMEHGKTKVRQMAVLAVDKMLKPLMVELMPQRLEPQMDKTQVPVVIVASTQKVKAPTPENLVRVSCILEAEAEVAPLSITQDLNQISS